MIIENKTGFINGDWFSYVIDTNSFIWRKGRIMEKRGWHRKGIKKLSMVLSVVLVVCIAISLALTPYAKETDVTGTAGEREQAVVQQEFPAETDTVPETSLTEEEVPESEESAEMEEPAEPTEDVAPEQPEEQVMPETDGGESGEETPAEDADGTADTEQTAAPERESAEAENTTEQKETENMESGSFEPPFLNAPYMLESGNSALLPFSVYPNNIAPLSTFELRLQVQWKEDGQMVSNPTHAGNLMTVKLDVYEQTGGVGDWKKLQTVSVLKFTQWFGRIANADNSNRYRIEPQKIDGYSLHYNGLISGADSNIIDPNGLLNGTEFYIIYTYPEDTEKPEPQPELAGIEVTKEPTKTEYYVGDTFNPAGLEVTAHYNGGADKVLKDSEYTLSEPDMSTAGTKTVTVTHQGKTDTFEITVSPKPVEPVSPEETPGINQKPDAGNGNESNTNVEAGIGSDSTIQNDNSQQANEKNSTDGQPKTGDESLVNIYILVVLASSISVAVILLLIFKKRNAVNDR